MNLLDDVDARPAVRLERWLGHRIDIGVKVDRGRVSFICRDLYEALRLDLDMFEAEPDKSRPQAERALHCTTWSLERLATVFQILDTSIARELISWCETKVNELEQHGLDNIERESLAHPAPIEVLGDDTARGAGALALPAWYSVTDAAGILSRDPSISIGQKRLFDWLRERGWVTRPGATFEPAPDLVAIGYLRIVQKRVRMLDQPYPQICITPAGLRQLHARLGGTGVIDLTAPHIEETP